MSLAIRVMSGLILLVMLLGRPVPAQEADQRELPEKKPRTIALKETSLREGQLLPGYALSEEPPLTGWRARIGRETLAFFDLDRDGTLEPMEDGLSMPPYPFVVPIPKVLLLQAGQFRIEFEGTEKLILREQVLGPVQKLASDAALVSELRIRAGLSPAAIDPEASASCEKHCDYLKRNGLADGSGGVSAHEGDDTTMMPFPSRTRVK